MRVYWVANDLHSCNAFLTPIGGPRVVKPH